MKTIKWLLGGYLLVITGLWWWTDQSDFGQLQRFIEWRNVLVQYSGVMGIAVMSLAMMLALRPVRIEQYLGGMDKIYRLHKWLGISGLLLAISHWVLTQSPKWLSAVGLLQRRGPRPTRPALVDGSLQQFFSQQRGLAEHVGEWAFYVLVILLLFALIKKFPYKRFLQTHRVLPVVYLALVFHSVFLLQFRYWTGPLGAVLVVLLSLGSFAAVMSLLGKKVGAKPAQGYIAHWQALTPEIVAVDIQLEGIWSGHQAGQFAFVRLHEHENAHPFTIASAWQKDGHLRFLIKGLGDYTQTLSQHLKLGDRVTVEGPYGQFNFQDNSRRQIWISAGIGVTPFLAQLSSLAPATSHQKSIDFFHCESDVHPIMTQLQQQAAVAQIHLHPVYSQQQGRLSAEQVMRVVPEWRQADIWFCGPVALGQTLKHAFMAQGLTEAQFHQELFEMR